jgi:hypothetical protein
MKLSGLIANCQLGHLLSKLTSWKTDIEWELRLAFSSEIFQSLKYSPSALGLLPLELVVW